MCSVTAGREKNTRQRGIWLPHKQRALPPLLPHVRASLSAHRVANARGLGHARPATHAALLSPAASNVGYTWPAPPAAAHAQPRR